MIIIWNQIISWELFLLCDLKNGGYSFSHDPCSNSQWEMKGQLPLAMSRPLLLHLSVIPAWDHGHQAVPSSHYPHCCWPLALSPSLRAVSSSGLPTCFVSALLALKAFSTLTLMTYPPCVWLHTHKYA
jgi:hypothetical protein